MATQRTCDGCGRPYMPQRSTSKYCSDTCRKRGLRRASESRTEPQGEQSALYAATFRELDDAGIVETRLGQQVLAAATKLGSDYDTGSAFAAASKELDRLMDKALAGAVSKVSRVDEMRARRDAKRNRATAG